MQSPAWQVDTHSSGAVLWVQTKNEQRRPLFRRNFVTN